MADEDLTQTVKGYLVQLRDAALELRSEGAPLSEAQDQLSSRFQAMFPDWEEVNWIANAVQNVYTESGSRL